MNTRTTLKALTLNMRTTFGLTLSRVRRLHTHSQRTLFTDHVDLQSNKYGITYTANNLKTVHFPM